MLLLLTHRLLIGLVVASKPFKVMQLNPIKRTLNISTQRRGGGGVIKDERLLPGPIRLLLGLLAFTAIPSVPARLHHTRFFVSASEMDVGVRDCPPTDTVPRVPRLRTWKPSWSVLLREGPLASGLPPCTCTTDGHVDPNFSHLVVYVSSRTGRTKPEAGNVPAGP